jgi:hypothetical protein
LTLILAGTWRARAPAAGLTGSRATLRGKGGGGSGMHRSRRWVYACYAVPCLPASGAWVVRRTGVGRQGLLQGEARCSSVSS